MGLNIKNVIQSVAESLTALPIFIYGTRSEVNQYADSVNAGKPVVFMLGASGITMKFDPSGGIAMSYSIILQFMEQSPFGQFLPDNDPLISRQIASAAEFLVSLRDYKTTDGRPVFNIVTGRDQASVITALDSYDGNYSGVTLTINNLRARYIENYC